MIKTRMITFSLIVVLAIGFFAGRYVWAGDTEKRVGLGGSEETIEKKEQDDTPANKELDNIKIDLALLDSRLLKIEKQLTDAQNSDEGTPSSNEDTTTKKVAYVSSKYNSVNTRTGPGQENSLIQKVNKGVPMPIIGESGEWYKISLENGKEAWVAKWVVDVKEE